jgi:hypothetical protein
MVDVFNKVPGVYTKTLLEAFLVLGLEVMNHNEVRFENAFSALIFARRPSIAEIVTSQVPRRAQAERNVVGKAGAEGGEMQLGFKQGSDFSSLLYHGRKTVDM